MSYSDFDAIKHRPDLMADVADAIIYRKQDVAVREEKRVFSGRKVVYDVSLVDDNNIYVKIKGLTETQALRCFIELDKSYKELGLQSHYDQEEIKAYLGTLKAEKLTKKESLRKDLPFPPTS